MRSDNYLDSNIKSEYPNSMRKEYQVSNGYDNYNRTEMDNNYGYGI